VSYFVCLGRATSLAITIATTTQTVDLSREPLCEIKQDGDLCG
jgi:hypothetical protein